MFDSLIDLGRGAALFLEREAGHSSIALLLIGIGMAMVDVTNRAAMAHDLVVFALGVLSRGLGAKKEG